MIASPVYDPPLPVGLHVGIPQKRYLAIDAMGSTRLESLAISPLHYQYRLTAPEKSPAMDLGTALHAAVLEPESFDKRFVLEPLDIAKDAAKPRATKAYKDAVADIEQGGFTVLRAETLDQVRGMAAAVHGHPHAARLLEKLPRRELTMLWQRGGRRFRGRVDALGEGAACDIKTTRSLKDFSPWAISKFGYHRQAALYDQGLVHCDCPIQHFFFIAVESAAPYDVGVFALEPDAMAIGQRQIEKLLAQLDRCEAANEWPGMFSEIQAATVSDYLLSAIDEEAVA